MKDRAAHYHLMASSYVSVREVYMGPGMQIILIPNYCYDCSSTIPEHKTKALPAKAMEKKQLILWSLDTGQVTHEIQSSKIHRTRMGSIPFHCLVAIIWSQQLHKQADCNTIYTE